MSIAQEQPAAQRRSSRPLVILAVDDEPMVRRVVAQSLSREFLVVSAASAAEALELMGQRKFDLVLTDISMPEMTGLDLADRVLREFPNVPVAFLSAYLDDDIGREAVRRSSHLIAKPFDVTSLAPAVRQILVDSGFLEAPAQERKVEVPDELQRDLEAPAVVYHLKETVSNGKPFKIKVPDTSLHPMLKRGDVIEIAKVSINALKPNDLVYVHQGDVMRARRFVRVTHLEDRAHLVVRGEMTRQEDAPLPVSRLIGRVTGCERASAQRGKMATRSLTFADLKKRFAAWYRDFRIWMDLNR